MLRFDLAPHVDVSILDDEGVAPAVAFGPPASLFQQQPSAMDTCLGTGVNAPAEEKNVKSTGMELEYFKMLQRGNEVLLKDLKRSQPSSNLQSKDSTTRMEEKVIVEKEERCASLKRSREEPTDRTVGKQLQEPEVDATAFCTPVVEFSEAARSDYQGRSFTFFDDSAATIKPSKIPKKLVHSFKGHEAGIQALAWFPTGHLLFSSDLLGQVRMWDVHTHRKQVALYCGHTSPIRTLGVTQDGSRFSSASVDGLIREWATETGAVKCSLSDKGKACLCHCYHPIEENNIVAGMDKEIVLFDTRSGKAERHYEGHLGPVMCVQFLDGGQRLLSTAEDKTIRTWDFRLPVQIQTIGDATMHAVPHIARHPTENILAAQSHGNKVMILQDMSQGRLKVLRERSFSGHMVSGTACQLAFSRDGQYLCSGDANGKVTIWNYRSGVLEKQFQAHSQVAVSVLWHPKESTKLVTSSWDKTIKMWS